MYDPWFRPDGRFVRIKSVRLTATQIERLNKLAEALGINTAQVVGRAIDELYEKLMSEQPKE
jgi:predicted DNA-binding protein